MESDIRRALQRAENGTKVTPKVDTAKLSSQGSKAGKEFGDRFSAGAKQALGALSAITVGAGVVESFRKVLSVGLDWTNNLNTLQAVTGATNEQLKAAAASARQLGNDISLPATSANDAASAMTELAKGGFSVQQAMDAAKGSLQLAAAAQISASDAATIQVQTLQAFGLQATDATKISDTLANAANASSAEISDVAMALGQAGTVANQFGLSAQDTAAAIGLLANNGIKGSDAGTLLKTSLLALTDQGNPAQGAIKELGLQVYDAQGKFVGLHTLFQQLGDAAKRMTPEQYQAATAVLFGSDAMRIAGVAAKDGSQSYDSMRTSIDRQGAAADVAAAKTKGLPGAWERVKNALESLQLNTYGMIEGPLTRAADFASTALGNLPATLGRAFDQLRNNPVVRGLATDTKSAFQGLVEAVKGAAPGIGQIAVSLGKAAGAIGVGVWHAFVFALQTAAGVLQIITPALTAIAGLMSNHTGLVTAAVGAWVAFKTVPAILSRLSGAITPVATAAQTMTQRFSAASTGVGNFFSAYRTHVGYLQQTNPSMSTAAANIQTLGRVASATASGGFGLLKGAAGGLVSALGGPWGVAITAGTVLIGLLASSHEKAAEAARKQQEAEKQLRAEIQATLDKETGRVTEETRNKAATELAQAGAAGKAKAVGLDPATLVDAATGTGDPAARDKIQAAIQQRLTEGLGAGQTKVTKAGSTFSNKDLLKQLSDAGIKSGDVTAALLHQGTAWDDVNKKIADLHNHSLDDVLQKMIDQMPQASKDALALAQSVNTLSSASGDGTAKQRELNEMLNGTWTATQTGIDKMKELGATIVGVPKGTEIDVNVAPDKFAAFKAKMEEAKLTVVQLPDGTVKVTAETDEAKAALAALVQKANDTEIDVKIGITGDLVGQIRAQANQASAAINAAASPPPPPGHASGAIVMANGGLRQILKPDSADIYAGRGAGTIFAEQETGGEAYIPLAPGKRGRSRRILAEVARRFGMNMMEDGGITVEALKQFASQISGGKYVRGGGNGDTLSATDCSGAQATLANFITGGSGRFATGSEAGALLSRGFQQGDPPPGVAAYWVGWVNGGPGGGHTAGTIVDPQGGNVNVEMGGAHGGGQYGAGAAGASKFPNRAWIQIAGGENPNTPNSFSGSTAAVQSAGASLTRAKASVTSAQASLDQANAEVDDLKKKGASDKKVSAAEKKRDAAQQKLDAAQERQTAAETKLGEVKDKAASAADKSTKGGGMDASSLGQSLVSGVLQGIGLDGSVFSNPLDWPNVKSGMALLNFGGGLLKGVLGQDDGTDPTGGLASGLGGGIGLPDIGGLLKPMGPQALTPNSATPMHGNRDSAPTIVNNGVIGMDPRALTQRVDAHQNQAWRKNMSAVRPG